LKHSIFSDIEEAVTIPYNGELEDLEHIDLGRIYHDNSDSD